MDRPNVIEWYARLWVLLFRIYPSRASSVWIDPRAAAYVLGPRVIETSAAANDPLWAPA